MKNIKLLATIFILVVITACENQKINPSSNITVQDRTLEDYTGIEISTVFDVELTISDTEEKIEIEANDNLHAYIDVFKDGGDLVIKIKDNTNITGKATLKARITTASPLEKITVRDASNLVMTNELTTNEILLAVSDASFMNAKVAASSAQVRLEGASRLDLAGTCNQMDVYVYDASELNGLEMSVNDVVVELEGASNASLTVNETIDLTAKDAAVFSYKGNAVITDIDLKDAAQIKKLD